MALAVSGCGGGSGPGTGQPRPQLDPPQAAEPVGAPPAKGGLPGRSLKVGAKPEGVAIDARTGLAAVAVQSPPQLVLVDTRGGRIVRRVPLPGTARHVSLAAPGGPFLVPVEPDDSLVEVRFDGTTRRTEVGDNPHDATAVGDRYFVADEFGSTLTVVRNGAVVGEVPVDAQPGGVATVGDQVAVIAVRAYTVELYDGRADRPRGGGGQSAGLGPSHVVTGPGGRLAIADTRGHALVVYDTEPKLRFARRIPLDGTPLGLATGDDGRVWVALSERNRAFPVDLETGRSGRSIRTVRDPFSLAAGDGVLAIASRSTGTLQITRP